ncbi:hypothetical protein [Halobacteriovorax sp. BALOs_7]|uniref:hypothetical protein n=1 Tax=unclassified Halobacteriovorax TaxID=2639665 RepID=UPI0013C4707D|nr:hypothetical protein [Halobacteriovorax sp. BALOs_7]
MQKSKQFFIITVLAFFQLNSLAMMGAKVIALSKSGRSVKLDVGKVAGLKTGDVADVSIKLGTLEKPKFIYLGSIELLKLSDRSSSWYFKTISGDKLNRSNFKKDDFIRLQIRSRSESGRSKKKPVYNVKAFESKNVKRNNRYAIDGVVPANLVQEKEVPNEENYDSDFTDNTTYKVTEKSMLKDGNEVIVEDGRLKYKYINSKLSPVDVSRLSDEDLDTTLGSQHQNQLSKISSKQDGYEEMYYNGRGSLTGPTSSLSIQNTMDETLARERAKNSVTPSAKAALNKEGPLWSADMDSEQLSNYLKASGIAREKFRRENVLAIESGNEVQFSFISNLLANYSDSDSNHQNLGYGLAIGYEFHLIRAHKALGKWSVDFGLDATNLNVDIGGVNARMTFTNIGAHINYYFYNTPYIRNKLQAYVGLGIKRGVGEATSGFLNGYSYDYESVALPSITLGVKTRLSSFRDYEQGNMFGWGIGAKLNYELLSLNPISEIDSSDDSNYTLNQTVNNIKLIASLSMFF